RRRRRGRPVGQMSCEHWENADVLGFLAEPGAAAFAAFREHYPGCAQCAAEVHAWSELTRSLARAAGDRHPREEQLLAYDTAPDAAPGAERSAVQRHLAGCRSCREELPSLRRFPGFAALPEPAAARAPATAPIPVPAPVPRRAREPGAGALAALWRWIAHPAP